MNKAPITDETKLADLTIGDLKGLLREMMESALQDFMGSLPDPDQGKTIRPEIEAELEGIEAGDSYHLLEEIKRTLGLDVNE
ncbi:MAG: hypothetical protein HZC41_25725 [Chloroflexi bacterium]|nr:hypothetical protein [Chloroflexota bacterium]